MEIASVKASSKHGALALNYTADSLHIYIDFESPFHVTKFRSAKLADTKK
jgi:hypothetical protein